VTLVGIPLANFADGQDRKIARMCVTQLVKIQPESPVDIEEALYSEAELKNGFAPSTLSRLKIQDDVPKWTPPPSPVMSRRKVHSLIYQAD
jgi:hypothetical protein